MNFTSGLLIGIIIAIPISLVVLSTVNRNQASAEAPRFVSRKTYTNVEEWEILKDPETGRVKGVRVHRTAEEA